MPTPRLALLTLSALSALAACAPSAPARSAAPPSAAPLPTCTPDTTVAVVPDDAPPALIRDAPPASDAAIYTPSTEQQAVAARLAGSIVVGGHAFDYLRELADTYGARMTGSPAYARAAAWAAESFKRAGVDSVAFEEVPIAAGWERHEATSRIVAPFDRPLHVLAGAWSIPTPPEGVKGEIVTLKDLSAEAIRAQTYSIRGKIVLVERSAYLKNDKVSWKIVVEAPDALKKAGALALFAFGSREGQAMAVSGGGTIDHMVSALPRATIGREDGLLLQRLAEKGPVTITYTNTSPVTGPLKVPNIVAEIRGREKPDEWVLVGAHFDSWDLATGAQDNGSGAAEVLEAARAIHALGTAPRRSIRFALYCGEEEGLHGSNSYAATHAKELDKAVFVLNTDYGAGAPKGWNVNGRDDEKRALQPLATSLLAGLGGDALTTKMRCDTDDCSFVVRGVPTANLDVDVSKYGDIHHLAADTLDKVTRASLDAGAAVVAVTAYAIADAPGRLSPRIDRSAVKAHLDKGEMLEEVQVSGLWK
jgi:carboxypeptidase Q